MPINIFQKLSHTPSKAWLNAWYIMSLMSREGGLLLTGSDEEEDIRFGAFC